MKILGWSICFAVVLAQLPALAEDATPENDRVQQGGFSVPAWIISSPPAAQPEHTVIINNNAGAGPSSYPGFVNGNGLGTTFGYARSPFGGGWNSGYGGIGPGTVYSGAGWGSPWGGGAYRGGFVPGFGGGGFVPGFGGGGFVPGFGGGGFGYGAPIAGWGRGFGGWGGGGFGGWGGRSLAWGGTGYGAGFYPGLGGYGGGFGRYGGLGGFAPGFGGGAWGWGNPGMGAAMMGAAGAMGGSGNHSMFGGATVIDDTPSKPAGNYYAPSTPNPSAAGNYYARTGSSVAYPVQMPSTTGPKDYWGPAGNPFPKDIMSTPWSK
ncbi:MAG TPA: hypothetical protein V6C69_07485 [Trichormus sp.]|jgi:hypothetical protein